MKYSKYLNPKKYFHFIISKIKNIFSNIENGGERVDIVFNSNMLLNDNEKCHLNRYLFANSLINEEDSVADFACGTGYGSAIMALKAKSVLGIDIDADVVSKIDKKYKSKGILNLSFKV